MARRPTRAEVEAARGGRVADVIATDLDVLFCGVNPSLYSAAVGHHFARPGNRFWPTLHLSGFTDRRLAPEEDRTLPDYDLGVTNLVARATASADELSKDELVRGRRALRRKVARHRPAFVAVLGVVAYRQAFARPRAQTGLQEEGLVDARVWVLPNPSGLNAHYQLPELAALFAALREAARSSR